MTSQYMGLNNSVSFPSFRLKTRSGMDAPHEFPLRWHAWPRRALDHPSRAARLFLSARLRSSIISMGVGSMPLRNARYSEV